MIKACIFALTMLFANYGFAKALYEYDLSTAENIQSIYWLTKAEDSAIVYARFEGFYALRELIDQTLLTGNISSKDDVDLNDADKLLLMMLAQNNILEMFITDHHLIFNGLSYQLNRNLINKIKATNDYRIDKGDLISPGTLAIARERFGSHR